MTSKNWPWNDWGDQTDAEILALMETASSPAWLKEAARRWRAKDKEAQHYFGLATENGKAVLAAQRDAKKARRKEKR